MATQAQDSIDVFENPNKDRNYEIVIDTEEFTCLCPLTGQPDFATIKISYIPDELCIELKSLKLYFWSFRDRGVFHEAITNEILDHLVNKIKPRFMQIKAYFKIRGGLTTKVVVTHPSPKLPFQ